MSGIISVAETRESLAAGTEGLAVVARFGLEARGPLVILQALMSAWSRSHFSVRAYPGSQGHYSSFRRLLLQINVLERLAKPTPLIHFPLLHVINLSLDDNVAPIRDLNCLGKEPNRHDAAMMSLLAQGLLWDSSSN